MTRDQKIADLVLHGYVPYEGAHGWVAIWSEERGEGCICKFFDEGLNGPGWDVRILHGDKALHRFDEVLWMCITDDQLAQMTLPDRPPKFEHGMAGIRRAMAKMDELGTDSLGADDILL